MSVAKQIFREFWAPFALAGAWVVYRLSWHGEVPGPVGRVLEAFMPAFFLSSWALAQWFRVKKQQHVESGREGIERQVEKMLLDLDEKTENVIGQISGGDSACYAVGYTPVNGIIRHMLVQHIGRFPLYDVDMYINDFDKLRSSYPAIPFAEASAAAHVTKLELAYIRPEQRFSPAVELKLPPGEKRTFTIEYSARNGSFRQLLCYCVFRTNVTADSDRT